MDLKPSQEQIEELVSMLWFSQKNQKDPQNTKWLQPSNFHRD